MRCLVVWVAFQCLQTSNSEREENLLQLFLFLLGDRENGNAPVVLKCTRMFGLPEKSSDFEHWGFLVES